VFRVALVVLALLAFLALGATGASAATYSVNCPDPSTLYGGTVDAAVEVSHLRQEEEQSCAAIAERLEAVVSLLEAQNDEAATPTATRVALAPDDRDRLDLMWWGMWALVGLTFVLIVSPLMQSAFRWWQE
jgi:hypothetical protein